MNKLIFLVGLPGSGKSTYAEKNLTDCEILSSDKLRQELLNDVNNQNHNQYIFNMLFKRAKEFLGQGKNVVIDATNVNKEERLSALTEFDDFNVKRIAIVFNVPVEECFRRDGLRERKVGLQVIKNLNNKFTIPTTDEGFDEIKFVE